MRRSSPSNWCDGNWTHEYCLLFALCFVSYVLFGCGAAFVGYLLNHFSSDESSEGKAVKYPMATAIF